MKQVSCPNCQNDVALDLEGEESTIDVHAHCTICNSEFNVLGEETLIQSTVRKPSLGQFEFLDKLGTGTYGNVWKARDTRLDRLVAVKIPRHEQIRSSSADSFLREARAAAQITHQNIVGVHEVGQENDTTYIVSDFIDGVSLSDWLSAKRPSPRDSVRLMITIARAVHHAHECGVIHRDLKPSNILMDREGNPFVTDFGLAKRDSGEATVTMDGQVMGTAAYMSPEQAAGESHHVDRRADVYALGTMLYELLTGERPFRGNMRMLMHQVIHDDPQRPSALNATIPKDLETICLKCLEKKPEQRFATAGELADELDRYLRGDPILSRPISTTERAWRWCKKYPIVCGLLAAVILSLNAGIAVSSYFAYTASISRDKARTNLTLAKENEQKAKEQEREAKSNFTLAEKRRVEAVTNEELAKKSLALAEERLVNLQRTVYNSQLQQVSQLYKEQAGYALQLLYDERYCTPERREFAWGMLHGLSRQDLASARAHEGEIQEVMFSRDDHSVLTVGTDGYLRKWDATTLKLLAEYQHGPSLHSVAISSDGQTIAVGDFNGQVLLLDLEGFSDPRLLRVSSASIHAVQFLQDDEQLVVADWNGSVTVWEIERNQLKESFRAHQNIIHRMELSPDEDLLVTCSHDTTVKVWDTKTWQAKDFQIGHSQCVRSIAIHPKGKQLATSGDDGYVGLWSLETGELLGDFPPGGKVCPFITYNKTGQSVVTIGRDENVVAVFQAKDFEQADEFQGHHSLIMDGALSHGGRRLATVSEDGELKVWDMSEHTGLLGNWGMFGAKSSNEEPIRQVTPFGGGYVTCGAWSPNGDRFAIAGAGDFSVRVHDASHMKQVSRLIGHKNYIYAMDWSHDGGYLATADENGTVCLWDTSSWKLDKTIPLSALTIWSLKFTPDGNFLYAACGENSNHNSGDVVAWDLRNSAIMKDEIPNAGAVWNLDISHDGKYLITAGSNNMVPDIIVWDLEKGELIDRLRGHRNTAMAVAISPVGDRFATASRDYSIILWNLKTLEPLETLKSHRSYVHSLDFSPDGETLLSGSHDTTMKMFDAQLGQLKAEFKQHTACVRNVSFSPRGDLLLSACEDGMARVWRPRFPEPDSDEGLRTRSEANSE